MPTVTIEPAERTQLETLARSTKDAKTAKRILVVLALDAGYRVKEVASLFLLDEDTVAKWRNKYLRRRLFSDWLATDHHGYDGQLTRDQEYEIEQYVEAEIVTDAAALVVYLKDHYNISYTVNGVTKLLHRLYQCKNLPKYSAIEY